MPTPANLNGILLIDKPSGLTSHDVVNRVRYSLKPSRFKVGHTGTLDPFATGLLIIALGTATRLIQYSHQQNKTYEAIGILGASTPSGDSTSAVSPVPCDSKITLADVKKILPNFIGQITQIPPAYSAVKFQGQPLYKLAHQGQLAEAQARAGERGRIVTIHDIQIIKFNYPELHLRVRCGTGTYIRSLVQDIGSALNTAAYTQKLTRVAIGTFHISDDQVIHNLSTLSPEFIHSHLLSPQSLVDHLPKLSPNQESVAQLQQGRAVPVTPPPVASPYYAIFSPKNDLIGIGTISGTPPLLHPKTILASEPH